MNFTALCFLLGVLSLEIFSKLPSLVWLWLLFPVICATLANKKIFFFPLIFSLGCAWMLAFAHYQVRWRLPADLEGKDLQATGLIANIPHQAQHGMSLLFKLQTLNHVPTTAFIRLMWDISGDKLHPGDQWQIAVRLKKIYGNRNPGTYDYEAYAFQEGIRASGYVITKQPAHLLGSHLYHFPLNRFRELIKHKIAANLPATPTANWILALIIGERHNINAADWEVLRKTGTNHLMAIAGLHIGLMVLLSYSIVVFVWRRQPSLCLRIPAIHAGAIVSLLVGLIYGALAGFSIPAQRACIMLSFFTFFLLRRRHNAAWQAWSAALIVVLIINPLVILTESFWLSFGAVAFIIYGVNGRLKPQGLWWQYGRIQWVITLGLLPMSIWLFQAYSFISFVANAFAIPLVAYLIIPTLFLACITLTFSVTVGRFLLIGADKLLQFMWLGLTWFANLPHMVWYQALPPTWMLLAAMIGIILLLVPAGFPGRYLGIIFLLPMLCFKPLPPAENSFIFTLLDVGQGLAAVVRTQHHTLVFDAGAHTSPSFDMGESVVLPFLQTATIQKIDVLVISHGDNDHIGGAAALMHRLPIAAIKTSATNKLVNSQACLRGEAWNWDGVKFEFLYPTVENLGLNNNSSCVLQVSVGRKKLLLTGDIEKPAEHNLVNFYGKLLASQVLVAPHHGSKTSADDAFITAVNPVYVLFPFGYRNRYHFPHASVIKKYMDDKVILLDTVKSGAIEMTFSTHTITKPMAYRQSQHNFWNN